MAFTLSIDGGSTFIEIKNMSEEQVHSAIKEIKIIAECVDEVRDMLDNINTATDRELLSAILEIGDIWIDCSGPY